MTAASPSARRARFPLLLTGWIAIASLACSCAGGSGSSGFDISRGAEDLFIRQALDERRCVDAGGLAICPTDTESLALPAPIDQPGPGPVIEDVALGTEFAEGRAPCVFVGAVGDECSIVVRLRAAHLPAGALTQLVARPVAPDGPWRVGDAVAADAANELTGVRVPGNVERIQIAVLVFVSGVPVAAGEIESLREAGADLAFVTEPLELDRG